MEKEKVHSLLDHAKFVFARSMPTIPHEYTHRKTWEDDSEFVDVVLFIRNNGVKEKFYKREFIYYYYKDYKYWTMGCPTHNCSKTGTIIINRSRCTTQH